MNRVITGEREIFVAFVTGVSLSAQKNLLRERLRTTLKYNPGSASRANLTVKRPMSLSSDHTIDALTERIHSLIARKHIQPFEADLGNVSTFTRSKKGKGVVHLPVLGSTVKEVTSILLSELNLPKAKYDGGTPHISLATVKLDDLQVALEQAKLVPFPKMQRFARLVIFEKTTRGSGELIGFDLLSARAA